MIKRIVCSSEYFNATDTLECGQIFRYFPLLNGEYLVISGDKACTVQTKGENTVIKCNEEDEQYFFNYFDLQTDYKSICERAKRSEVEILKKAATLGKGVRILRQNSEEMLYSFLISQNNNIPRIKKAVNAICEKLGEKREFEGHVYHTFPSSSLLFAQSEEFYKSCGLGYRASYMKKVSESVVNGLIEALLPLSREKIKEELLHLKGVGEKVADCVCLFGFYKTDSFPVDVWIEKIYREDFGGDLNSRKKITEYFLNLFGFDSGYFQQYLFYYKRSLEKRQN